MLVETGRYCKQAGGRLGELPSARLLPACSTVCDTREWIHAGGNRYALRASKSAAQQQNSGCATGVQHARDRRHATIYFGAATAREQAISPWYHQGIM